MLESLPMTISICIIEVLAAAHNDPQLIPPGDDASQNKAFYLSFQSQRIPSE